jgi:hypothetical protein
MDDRPDDDSRDPDEAGRLGRLLRERQREVEDQYRAGLAPPDGEGMPPYEERLKSALFGRAAPPGI